MPVLVLSVGKAATPVVPSTGARTEDDGSSKDDDDADVDEDEDDGSNDTPDGA